MPRKIPQQKKLKKKLNESGSTSTSNPDLVKQNHKKLARALNKQGIMHSTAFQTMRYAASTIPNVPVRSLSSSSTKLSTSNEIPAVLNPTTQPTSPLTPTATAAPLLAPLPPNATPASQAAAAIFAPGVRPGLSSVSIPLAPTTQFNHTQSNPNPMINPTQSNSTQSHSTQQLAPSSGQHPISQPAPAQSNHIQPSTAPTLPNSTLTPTQPNLAQVNALQSSTTQLNPTQVNPTQVNPTQVNSTQVNSTQLNALQSSPQQQTSATPVMAGVSKQTLSLPASVQSTVPRTIPTLTVANTARPLTPVSTPQLAFSLAMNTVIHSDSESSSSFPSSSSESESEKASDDEDPVDSDLFFSGEFLGENNFDSDSDSDYFRDIHIVTEEELIRRRRDKIRKLLKLYKAQFKRLKDKLRTRHHRYLKDKPASSKQAEEGYNGSSSENESSRKSSRSIQLCKAANCKSKRVPPTVYCFAHILMDSNQKLFKNCAHNSCTHPILTTQNPPLCPSHVEQGTDKQLDKKRKEPEHTEEISTSTPKIAKSEKDSPTLTPTLSLSHSPIPLSVPIVPVSAHPVTPLHASLTLTQPPPVSSIAATFPTTTSTPHQPFTASAPIHTHINTNTNPTSTTSTASSTYTTTSTTAHSHANTHTLGLSHPHPHSHSHSHSQAHPHPHPHPSPAHNMTPSSSSSSSNSNSNSNSNSSSSSSLTSSSSSSSISARLAETFSAQTQILLGQIQEKSASHNVEPKISHS